ncbi:hypothetical protein BJV74DRAFT_834567 [Russula compacta]|nr:hypothetical protein BJV74DRAFT_834567 [Russula compacta]
MTMTTTHARLLHVAELTLTMSELFAASASSNGTLHDGVIIPAVRIGQQCQWQWKWQQQQRRTNGDNSDGDSEDKGRRGGGVGYS